MAIDSKHPLYSEFFSDWVTLSDTFRGERVVKDKGSTYLPATSGQTADGMGRENTKGQASYDAYKQRAVFHDVVAEAVNALVGAMWHKPPTIELPAALDPLRERATIRGESLEMLLRRVNEEQLKKGRVGMLLELPEEIVRAPGVLPWIATYEAEQIINWDDGPRDDAALLDTVNLVVLEETEYERTSSFEWELEEKYRVLVLGDTEENEGRNSGAIYQQAVFRDASSTFDEAELVVPKLRNRKLEKIPFVFVNAKDICADPDDPPLLGLAQLALAIYRGEADYRQSLFLQGQDTFVTTGQLQNQTQGVAVRTGAGAHVQLETGGKAEFVGVDSSGIAEQREAIQNDLAEAKQKSAKLFDSRSKQKESGDALRIRVSSETATLNRIALTGAGALQEILRTAAEWVGANPDEVVVVPNTDFAAEEFFSKELSELMAAKNLGAPLSARSIHALCVKRDLTALTYEEELEAIAEEQASTADEVEEPPFSDEE